MGKRIHRLRRLLASGSPVLFAGGVALAGLAVSSLRTPDFNSLIVWVLLCAWLVLFGFQMIAEYQRRTYDPTLMFKFDDKFDSRELKLTRSNAATVLKSNQAGLGCAGFRSSDVDDVLDFFEALGFFMRSDQITPEVAHHAFFYWIRGYYSAVFVR